MEYKLYTDGACRGNGTKHAVAGAGVYITRSDGIGDVYKAIYLGPGITNNIAEYKSLILGLNELIKLKATKVNIFMDSNLVCNQVNGVFKTKNVKLVDLKREVHDRLKKLDEWTLTYIPREENTLADALANDAIDLYDGNDGNDGNDEDEYEVYSDGIERKRVSTLDAAKESIKELISNDVVTTSVSVTREYKIVHNSKVVFERIVNW